MRKKLSPVMIAHYISFTWRTALCVILLILWIGGLVNGKSTIMYHFEEHRFIMTALWVLFMCEMIARLFPSGIRSPGCQKQFARNYIKTGNTDLLIPDNNATVLIALVWIVFNGIFGALYMEGILDDGIMILLCSVYSVCDIVCILFFCPFQTWFMKNKCCSSCRIYNWDYAMMFTPLFFIRKSYTWSLLALSVALLIRWEVTFYLHPERYSEATNDYLKCSNCTEKLCVHKKQLRTLWMQIEEYSAKRIKRLKKQ